MNDQTVLIYHNGECREYPINGDKHLGDGMREYLFKESKVYAYILNRRKQFRHPYYGWGLSR